MTSYSGLWNNEYGQNYAALSDTVNMGNARTAFARVFADRQYGRGNIRALLQVLIGETVGGDNATNQFKRVAAERDLNGNVQGGKRVIETFTGIDRTTDADDVSFLNAALANNIAQPDGYPVDRSGNGGGSKLGW